MKASPTQNRGPFSDFAEMRLSMDEFMSGVLEQQRGGAPTWRPTIDVDEDEHSFSIHLELPGWEKRDVAVQINKKILTIRGQRAADRITSTTGRELPPNQWCGSFNQSLRLPPTIDARHISVRLAGGLLTVYLPKQSHTAPTCIAITTLSSSAAPEPAGG